MGYTMDKYDECVTNSTDTAEQVAMDLYTRAHVVTTWTDGAGSKHDIVWSFDATRIGRSSMVDAGPGKLFVGVVGTGCYGFSVGGGFLAPDYIREKLKVSGETASQLAALITDVRGQLASLITERPITLPTVSTCSHLPGIGCEECVTVDGPAAT
jgi:hypothetical protein